MKKVIIAMLLGVLGFACTHEDREPRARQVQRLEVDGGDGGDGDGGLLCAHPICAAGVALTAACDPCATLVCASDPWCCAQMWDATCVGEVTSICGNSCQAPPPPDAGTSTCVHPVCAAGAALASGCDACVTTLCAQDAYCCGVEWDATCVTEVTSICGQPCN
jgi:hypothetical protein